MKNLFFIFLLLIIGSCTPLKRAQTGMARAIAGSHTLKIGEHEVYCSEGKVCSEIDVRSIRVLESGAVRVELKNRTGNTALVQIRLQISDEGSDEFRETRPENVAIPSTQEKIYDSAPVAKKNSKVRVLLNVAY